MIDESTLISIKASWRIIYPADRATPTPGIICPLCGSGSGPNGTGLTEDPQHPGHLHCWRCGFAGDVIDLVMQDPNTSATTFAEAAAWAADHAGISIEPTDQTSFLQASQTQSSATDGLEESEAQKYLASRGISVETARGAGVRYESAWRHPSAPASVPTSPRIIIPTADGSAVTRDIRSSTQLDAQARKYVKQNMGPARLMGATAALAQPAPVFVVEGAFDALSIREIGAQAISLGSTANAGLLVEAVRHTATAPPLVLALDGDDAGQRAQSAMLATLTEMGVVVTTCDISGDYKDPNDALVADREEFRQRVESAIAAARKMIADQVVAQYTLTYDAYMSAVTEAHELISTGIDSLDKALSGGMCPFGLTMLGGRTGTGKTSLALQIAAHVIAGGRPVLYVPLEMTSVQLATKLIVHDTVDPFAPEPAITALNLLTGHVPDTIRPRIATYFRDTAPWLYVLERHPNMRVAEIGELCAQIHTATGMPPLAVIDYFQILPVDDPHMQDRYAINANIDALKFASDKYPMLIISAFNRMSYQIADGSSESASINHELIINSMESAYKETANLEYTAETLLGMRTVKRANDMTDIDLYVIKHRWHARSTEPVALTLHGPSGWVLQRSTPTSALQQFDDADFSF